MTSPTPTPLGAAGQQIYISGQPKGLALLANTVSPYIVRQADVIEIDKYGAIKKTLGSPISQPIAAAADGNSTLWVLSGNPAHVDRFALAMGVMSFAASFAVPASPVAIASKGGEAWIAAASGTLLRIIQSSGATASFTGFGSPTAIALDTTNAWVTSSTGELFCAKRSDGSKLNTFTTGTEPIAVTVDPGGTVWVANKGSASTTRLASGSITPANISLGKAPRTVVADARRVWFAFPDGMAFYQPDGTKEGDVTGLTFGPDALASDAYGRVWALSSQQAWVAPIWGKKAGE